MNVAYSTSKHGLSADDLRTANLQRRLRLSPSVARAYAEHAFGDGQRSDLAQLAALTAERVAASTGVHS